MKYCLFYEEIRTLQLVPVFLLVPFQSQQSIIITEETKEHRRTIKYHNNYEERKYNCEKVSLSNILQYKVSLFPIFPEITSSSVVVTFTFTFTAFDSFNPGMKGK